MQPVAKKLVLSALSAALIAVCTWISIPATVPFTLQTFAIYCILLLLGSGIGCRAVVVYLALGAIGAPVFSGFQGGIGVLIGPTGGYLLGFLFLPLLFWCSEKFVTNRRWISVISLLLGTAFCYAFGTLWFTRVYAAAHGFIGISTALSWCVFPFILPDLIKLILAILLAKRLKLIITSKNKLLNKSKGEEGNG